MYRPILLHILTNCSPSIRKALKEDGKYFFTNDYKWDKENKHQSKQERETHHKTYTIFIHQINIYQLMSVLSLVRMVMERVL